jgi:RNA polymerase sigma factor (sigma-70 family)
MTENEALISFVRRAQAGDREAYGWLVRRFQDMAVGYAASILGDFHLAEDAAQEAFLEAWRDLAQLREPAAFAGWLRRIVFKQCDRLTRGKRFATVPMEVAIDLAAPQPGPAEMAERRELQEAVRQGIRSLPRGEREVTMLFYIGDYSQQEIATFIGLSVITVKKRLAAARRRLKERMVAMVQDEVRAQRPSRDERFAARVLTFSQQFSEMIDGGTSLVRCLMNLAERQDDARFKAVIEQINQDVVDGLPLSRAVGRHPEFFPESYLKALRVGESTETLEIQMGRLAAGEPFEFEGDDNPERFRAESPTIAAMADGFLWWAIRNGVSEIQLLSYWADMRLDVIFLADGIVQQTYSFPSYGRKSPLKELPRPLFDRFMRLAGLAGHGYEQKGLLQFQHRDGITYEMPAARHRTYSGDLLVIHVRAHADETCQPAHSSM